MVLRKCMPIVTKTSTGIRSKCIMSVSRTWTGNPLIIGERNAGYVTYISPAKVYCELGWLKNAVGRLRFRYKGEKENNEYETKLLQVSSTLHLKLLQNDSILQMMVWKVNFRWWELAKWLLCFRPSKEQNITIGICYFKSTEPVFVVTEGLVKWHSSRTVFLK